MITSVQNPIVLHDLTRPFVLHYVSPTAINLVYVIQKFNFNTGVFEDCSGLLRQPVEFGSNGDFYINPSEILADEIDLSIRAKNQSSPLVHYDGYVKFRLLLTEESLSSNNTLTFDNLRSNWYDFGFAYGIDGATQHADTYQSAQYLWMDNFRMDGTSNTKRFLTNKPTNDTDLSITDNEYIYAFIDLKKTKVHITIEDIAQSTLHSFSTSFLLYGLNSIGIGVPNIIDAIGQSTWDAISNTAYRVRYEVKNFQGTRISEQGSYVINKEKCSKERLRVYWKNRRGGIDGYTFNSELEVQTNIKSQTFKKSLGYRRSSSEDKGSLVYQKYNTYYQGTRTMGSTNISASETIKVTSRFHTQEQLRWLSEMTTSPALWIENLQTGQLNAVYSITKKTITKPKGKGVGQMKLRLQTSNAILTQR